LNRGLDNIVCIVRTQTLCQNIFNSNCFKHCTNSTTCNQPCPFGCGTQKNTTCTIGSNYFMRNSAPIKKNLYHIPLGSFDAFANCFWHFVSLAQPPADGTFSVANHNKGAKAESSTTFDHFCYAANLYHLVNKILFNFALLSQLTPRLQNTAELNFP